MLRRTAKSVRGADVLGRPPPIDWLDDDNVPLADELGRAQHHVRQGGLNEFPPRDGPDGLGKARRQSHLDVLHQNLLQGLPKNQKLNPSLLLNNHISLTLQASFIS